MRSAERIELREELGEDLCHEVEHARSGEGVHVPKVREVVLDRTLAEPLEGPGDVLAVIRLVVV